MPSRSRLITSTRCEPNTKLNSIRSASKASTFTGHRAQHGRRQRNQWSLTSFARVFARLLGRTGGVSALTTQEMDSLATFHTRHEGLTESLLRQAFARAESPTIPEILFQLQSLLHERND